MLKVCNFVIKVEKTVLRWVGWVPPKSAGFGATAPAQKHPTRKKHFSREKPIGAISCMHKGPKCIESLWDYLKKIPFVQKNKEGAICAIPREKTPFWGIPRG